MLGRRLDSCCPDTDSRRQRTCNDRDGGPDREGSHSSLQGWLQPSGGLWVPGQDVIVTSPMLVMKGEKLKLKSVTYSQDNQQGTRVVLECCNDKAISGGTPRAGT